MNVKLRIVTFIIVVLNILSTAKSVTYIQTVQEAEYLLRWGDKVIAGNNIIVLHSVYLYGEDIKVTFDTTQGEITIETSGCQGIYILNKKNILPKSPEDIKYIDFRESQPSVCTKDRSICITLLKVYLGEYIEENNNLNYKIHQAEFKITINSNEKITKENNTNNNIKNIIYIFVLFITIIVIIIVYRLYTR